MSIAEFMDGGADYCEIFGNECDGDCENCEYRNECDERERGATWTRKES